MGLGEKVEPLQLLFGLGLDHREEHAELGYLEQLEESVEDVIIVEKVLPVGWPMPLEAGLDGDEESIQSVNYLPGQGGWSQSRQSPDNLQPLLYILLHP